MTTSVLVTCKRGLNTSDGRMGIVASRRGWELEE